MLTKKYTEFGWEKTKISAGPGQRYVNPYPKPKSADPIALLTVKAPPWKATGSPSMVFLAPKILKTKKLIPAQMAMDMGTMR